MKANEYLYTLLRKLVQSRPELKLECEFSDIAREYFVKVSPTDYFELAGDDFGRVIIDFGKKYPYEAVTFVKENDFFEVRNPDKVFKGADYDFSDLASRNNYVDSIKEFHNDYYMDIQYNTDSYFMSDSVFHHDDANKQWNKINDIWNNNMNWIGGLKSSLNFNDTSIEKNSTKKGRSDDNDFDNQHQEYSKAA